MLQYYRTTVDICGLSLTGNLLCGACCTLSIVGQPYWLYVYNLAIEMKDMNSFSCLHIKCLARRMHWGRDIGHVRDSRNHTSCPHFVPSTAQICWRSHRSDTTTILYNMQMTYIHTGGKAKQWWQSGMWWWNKVFPRNDTVNWIPVLTMLNP